jgi:stearoyl-CoA desaturase (delta-9 desaturase)
MARGIFPTTLDLGLCLGLYVLTLLGLEVGYHRYFTHGAFKTSRPFAVLLAFLGTITFEGGVIWWVGTHKRHHTFSDDEGDPHSPHYERHGGLRGFAYAHLGWLFDRRNINLGVWIEHVRPMYRDPILVFLNRYYFQFGVAFLVFPAVIGGVVGGTWSSAFDAFIWGGLIRVFLVTHAIFSLNSFCHMFGSRPFSGSRDLSRNCGWLALYTLGASWHNNHHAFPRTASNSFSYREIDLAGMVIAVLERLGVVWDVWRPTPDLISAKRAAAKSLPHFLLTEEMRTGGRMPK